MTYRFYENCIKFKFMDCGVCESKYPVETIHLYTDDNMEKQVEMNRNYSEKWQVVTVKNNPSADTNEWQKIENKFEKYFSKKPGI